ncbi:hypothetical protein DEO72_LG5g1730 [Vigna unguiculata]|uniref:Uncharacterized protein n=1 Tax=Vigna unguiculata TaxID=3917 RepID=A0A4D6M0P9_VIGUN|nr:hypothetical protein DEO72_LG5g1730 [Vigna unguiculata]
MLIKRTSRHPLLLRDALLGLGFCRLRASSKLFSYSISYVRSLSCCARVFGIKGASGRFASYSQPSPRRRGARLSGCVSPERDPSALSEGLGEAVCCLDVWLFLDGETSGATLQWSGRNSMAPVSGCPWWCPICITRIEQLRDEQRYPPQVQASAESDQVIHIRMSRVES